MSPFSKRCFLSLELEPRRKPSPLGSPLPVWRQKRDTSKTVVPNNLHTSARRPVEKPTVGFSVVEVLVVLAVIAVLAGIGVSSLSGLRKRLTLDEAAQTISQDIQRARANSLSSSKCTDAATCWRLRVTGPRSYALEEFETTWKVRESRQFPDKVSLTNVSSGNTIVFNTRGFASFSLTGSVPNELRVTDGTGTLRIIPSIVGAIKVVKL